MTNHDDPNREHDDRVLRFLTCARDANQDPRLHVEADKEGLRPWLLIGALVYARHKSKNSTFGIEGHALKEVAVALDDLSADVSPICERGDDGFSLTNEIGRLKDKHFEDCSDQHPMVAELCRRLGKHDWARDREEVIPLIEKVSERTQGESRLIARILARAVEHATKEMKERTN